MLPQYGKPVSYREALGLGRGNGDDKWPRRGGANRLEPEAWPNTDARFQLRPGQKIFTMGSCFARNIEEYLKEQGFELPTLKMKAPGEALGGRANAILNKYTPVSIAQEIAWTRRILDRDGIVRWEDIEPLALETSPGMYLDLQLDTTEAVSRERMLERRSELFEINKEGFESDVIVITPGVIEAWLDTKTGLYVQRMPTPALVKRFGDDRFVFKVLTYEECHAGLSRAIEQIDPSASKWFLFTVSPVPLRRTFTNLDIIIANQYSKSLLRAVVGRIHSERPNCDYFPSYESVMLTKQPYVWGDDLIHVTDNFVSKIVRRLVTDRMDQRDAARMQPTMDAMERFQDSMERGDNEGAMAAYREIGPGALDLGVPMFHQRAVVFHLQARDFPRAMAHANRFKELKPGAWRPLYLLAQAQHRAGHPGLALETARESLALTKVQRHADIVLTLIDKLTGSAGPAARSGSRELAG